MQPTTQLPSDIKTLQDYLFTQFKATDPMEVQNILSKPYYFKYCVNEEIETPDPVSRRVVNREYEEITLEPGETKILLGGAAYIFLGGIAGQYVFETQGADATGDLAKMVEAAHLAIVQKVGYEKASKPAPAQTAQTAPTTPHNPTAIADNNGQLPPQTTGDEDAFSGMGAPTDNPPISEFEHNGAFYDTTANGRYRMNKSFIKQEVFEAARDGYIASQQA